MLREKILIYVSRELLAVGVRTEKGLWLGAGATALASTSRFFQM